MTVVMMLVVVVVVAGHVAIGKMQVGLWWVQLSVAKYSISILQML
jgi:hypothetical protein